jgi:hypothetical protein
MDVTLKHLTAFSILLAGLLLNASYCQAEKTGRIFSAVFTTHLKDDAATDQVLILTNFSNKIFFVSDMRHFQGQKITHRWEYRGKTVAKYSFDINEPRVKISSSQVLKAHQLGTWRVVITDEKGWPLKAVIFKYISKRSGKDAILPVQ